MTTKRNTIVGVDHIQIAVPAGVEAACRAFYLDLLGFAEIERPVEAAGRSFLWVAAGDQQVHFRPDPQFRPAEFAHPGFAVSEIAALARRLSEAGHEISTIQAVGPDRFHVRDPFGNRLEFVGATSLTKAV